MNIPTSILQELEKTAGPMENAYFLHAINTIEALNKVTEDTYGYDFFSNEINALERLYKGFLQAAVKYCDWYELPSSDFLETDHDLLKLKLEIKNHFPDLFPRMEREQWRDTKNFLRDLRTEYTAARYSSYPAFSDFEAVRKYVNQEYSKISDYINNQQLEQSNEEEIPLDY